MALYKVRTRTGEEFEVEANNPFEARLNAENQGATNISFVTPSQVLNNPFTEGRGDKTFVLTVEDQQGNTRTLQVQGDNEDDARRQAISNNLVEGSENVVSSDEVAKAAQRRIRQIQEMEQARMEAENAAAKAAADAQDAVSILRQPTVVPEGTRVLVNQASSPNGTLYRSYDYTDANGNTTRKFFIVNADEAGNAEEAYQYEVEVQSEAFLKDIQDLELSDITAVTIPYIGSPLPGVPSFTITGAKIPFVSFNSRYVEPDGDPKPITETLPDWFLTTMRLNGNTIVQNEQGGIRIQEGPLPVDIIEGQIPTLPFGEQAPGPVELPTGAGTTGEDPLAPNTFIDRSPETPLGPQGGGGGGEGETVEVEPAGGSMSEILSSYGIDVGPFGVIAEDMPGLPPDFFDRDDYFVDVTTVKRDLNELFDRTQTEYQTSDAGFRIDSNGQPEYIESITINREPNPEIAAALEAYKLALQAKTNLSGSLAQVLSTHINATDGLGVGKDAFTAKEIANLRLNLASISATEGLLTYDSEGERQINEALRQARLQEITAAQRPDVQRQLVDLYSNPVAYGIITSTEEGQNFLNNLQQQATFTPFPTEIQQQEGTVSQDLGMQMAPTSANPLGGAPATSEEAFYIPPSARQFVTADEMQRGRMIADAAGAGIYGEQALERQIAERTPFGTNLSASYLAPFTLGSGTVADPFSGAQRGS